MAYNKPYHSVRIGTAHPPSVVQLCSGKPDNTNREVHLILRHPIKTMPRGEAGASSGCAINLLLRRRSADHFQEHRASRTDPWGRR